MEHCDCTETEERTRVAVLTFGYTLWKAFCQHKRDWIYFKEPTKGEADEMQKVRETDRQE